MENNHNFDKFSVPPDNYLIWAILSTILCCMPLGVVAIVKSSSVNTLWFQGRHDEAYKAAESAKSFSIWSAGIAVILWVLYFVFAIFFGLLSAF